MSELQILAFSLRIGLLDQSLIFLMNCLNMRLLSDCRFIITNLPLILPIIIIMQMIQGFFCVHSDIPTL